MLLFQTVCFDVSISKSALGVRLPDIAVPHAGSLFPLSSCSLCTHTLLQWYTVPAGNQSLSPRVVEAGSHLVHNTWCSNSANGYLAAWLRQANWY